MWGDRIGAHPRTRSGIPADRHGRSVPARGNERKHHDHLLEHPPPHPHDGPVPSDPSRHRGDPRPGHRRLRRRKGDGELQRNPGRGPGGRAGVGFERHGALPAHRTLPAGGVLSQLKASSPRRQTWLPVRESDMSTQRPKRYGQGDHPRDGALAYQGRKCDRGEAFLERHLERKPLRRNCSDTYVRSTRAIIAFVSHHNTVRLQSTPGDVPRAGDSCVTHTETGYPAHDVSALTGGGPMEGDLGAFRRR